MDSVSGDANYLRFTSNSKSGQFFFFTKDGNYMIKTITHEEVKVLRSVLSDYYQHIEANPASLIVRITGLYRVQMYHLQRTIYFIVMGSCYRGSMPRKMDVEYDIKGSTVGRNCDPGDSVRKDNDLIADGFRLRLGRNREGLLAQLRTDVEFLRTRGFVDYSLLIGAHRRETVAKHHPERVPALDDEAAAGEHATQGNSGGFDEDDDEDDDIARGIRRRGKFDEVDP